MNERPICFPQPTADAMVRAVLDGSKTQHRVPVVPPPIWRETTHHLNHVLQKHNPFGKPGDWLWMRECWADNGQYKVGPRYEYRAAPADGEHFCSVSRWRPSIHMPREACRIKRLVKRVWVEQVQAISHKDAVAEGLEDDAWLEYEEWVSSVSGGVLHSRKTLVEHYAEHWDSIYAAKGYGWDENPPVWGCEFVTDGSKHGANYVDH